MNFDLDPADERFRETVRKFLELTVLELFPDKMRLDRSVRSFDKSETRRWTCALDAGGYLVPHWPQATGVGPWPHTWRRILAEELFAVGCPQTDAIGTDFVGPVLCAFGSEEQKKRYLSAIRSGEQIWCQGFSEAQAGSDVMSLCTSAIRAREHYVINGRKLWTSNAHHSDMMFALLRIEVPGSRRPQGLSFVLIDMHSPGVHVKPVILIDGVHRVNEVLLENVRMPVTNLVGEPGKGWVYARYLLGNERAIVAGVGQIGLLLERLRLIAIRREGREEAPMKDSLLISRISQFEVELQALEFMELRLLHAHADHNALQILPPILKLRGSELRQRITDLSLQVLGEKGLETPFPLESSPDASAMPHSADTAFAMGTAVEYLFQRSATLAGGTSEIQKNIIAGIALPL